MNKQELEHKLEQARNDRELATAEANKEVDRLKKLLAEAEKPKLEHGDFGFDESIFPSGKPADSRVFLSGHSWGCVGNDHCDKTPLKFVFGNIFEILNGELTEFELKTIGLKVELDEDKLIIDDGYQGGDRVEVPRKLLSEFATNIFKMYIASVNKG